jgi:hypothetical protein
MYFTCGVFFIKNTTLCHQCFETSKNHIDKRSEEQKTNARKFACFLPT